MRRFRVKALVPVLLALLAACAREPAPATRTPVSPALSDPADMTQAAVDAERAVLEAIIVPPPGTARGDVEATFGPGAEGYPSNKLGKVSDPALRVWTLLPDQSPCEWGARLRVNFEGETVQRAHLDYCYVEKGLKIDRRPPEPEPGSPEWERKQAGPARKGLQILRDLREIRRRWPESLSRAVWNR